MNNEEKSKQLGMPFGTANARLRKKILFDLVQRCKLDFCYRCGLQIENINSFSIEHIKPWFGKSNDLFWDLENISFSHLSCNVAASNKQWSKNANAPEGLKWCSSEKLYVNEKEFYKDSNGNYYKRCAPCEIRLVDERRRRRGERPPTAKFTKDSKY